MPVRLGGLMAGFIGVVGAVGLSAMHGRGSGQFLFAYLIALVFYLSISLGALFFVALQHATRAGWSVAIRRPAEVLAANFPVLLVLCLPLLAGLPLVYRWVHSADPIIVAKSAYLNVPFFVARIIFYLLVWTVLGRYFWSRSVAQDTSADPVLTLRMQKRSPAALLIFAVTINFAAFDLLMSLDPHWYSTIFGVYYFGGSVLAFLAAYILVLLLLQRARLLGPQVTVEHYHDLGKLLFAFVFFWGYIAFSQYLLIWYANLPEETRWFQRRGATTVAADTNFFTILTLVLLFGHLLLPFGALLGRLAKRTPRGLAFWCVWLLVMHVADLFWLARPELLTKVTAPAGGTVPVDGFDLLLLLACLVGLGGFYLSAAARRAGQHSLLPVGDPRLAESLAFRQDP
jgi:hypothetical protein